MEQRNPGHGPHVLGGRPGVHEHVGRLRPGRQSVTRSTRSTPRSMPALHCSTPAISTAWASNEMLLAEALRDRPRDSYRLSVKFGGLRDPGNGWNGNDTRPAALKNFLAYSLQRLGTDYIDIYRPARLDPSVPIEETVGALADCVKAGLDPLYRPFRSRRSDAPQSERRPSDLRPADRICVGQPQYRARGSAGGARTGHRRYRLWHIVARLAERSLASRRG